MQRSYGNTYKASQRGNNLHLKLANAVDSSLQLVARLHGTDTRRRARINQVARLERVVLGQVGDLLRNRPDHVSEVRPLALLAVHFEPERTLCRMPGLARRVQHAARRAFIEILAEIPGAAMVLAPLLKIAAGHVQADG